MSCNPGAKTAMKRNDPQHPPMKRRSVLLRQAGVTSFSFCRFIPITVLPNG